MIHSLIKLGRLVLVTVIFQSLQGCGEGGSSGASTDTVDSNPDSVLADVNIYTEDIATYVHRGDVAVIDIANSVSSNDNNPLLLQTVVSVDNAAECNNIQLSEFKVSIDAQTQGVCVYQYAVSDLDRTTEQQGVLQVTMIERNATLTHLTPISDGIELSQELDIVLDNPNNLTLQSNVSVVGSGSVTVDSSSNTIRYIASSDEADVGVSQLVYTFEDSNGDLSVGSIFISVSSYTHNHIPPTFDIYHGTYDTNGNVEYSYVETNTETEIDITDYFQPGLIDSEGTVINDCDVTTPTSNCVYLVTDSGASNIRYLKDIDGDFLQLTDVRVFNASAVADAPTELPSKDLVNSTFKFTASAPGYYTVAYTLSDHKGGLAVGLIKIKVVSQLKDVFVTGDALLFFAPINTEQAEDARVDITGSVTGDGLAAISGYEQPLIHWESADGLCQSMGARLPTSIELASLYAQQGAIFASDAKWSGQDSYWSSTSESNTGFIAYDLATGQGEAVTPWTGKLVTCLNSDDINIRIAQSGELKASSEYQLTVEYKLNGNWIDFSGVNLPLFWSTDNESLFSVESSSGVLTTHEIYGDGNVMTHLVSDASINASSSFYICGDLADACLDLFDTGNGKLFTNTPSVAYLNSIDGSEATNGIYNEFAGPVGGFYLFNWNNANTLCDTYNTNSLGGRTNWGLATLDELQIELFKVYGSMSTARGWPSRNYWTMLSDGAESYFNVDLLLGTDFTLNKNEVAYTSCVSNP
ncbi:hypothetical protein F0Z19_5063 [Vibrio cyclitrophicus]|uniref:hypothetical protein n=1 Tax=unclassified Vibrio TaxID=2614977 RepID=UPI0012820C75|nr:hypothetical protein F0Z19_5063 [Vibrio cyclitrophicus]